MLVQAAMKNKLSKAEVIHVAQMRKLGKRMKESIQAVIDLKPVEDKTIILMGALAVDSLEQELSNLTQYQRNKILENIVGKVVGSGEQFGARLGTTDFTLMLTQTQRDKLSQLEDIEQFITTSLSKNTTEIESL